MSGIHVFAYIFPGTFIMLKIANILKLYRKTVEKEANIYWGCTMCNRTGLDLSYSLSHPYNETVILMLLSPFYKWRNWVLDRLWKVPRVTLVIRGRALSKRPSSFHNIVLASLITWQLAEKWSHCFTYIFIEISVIFLMNTLEGWLYRKIFFQTDAKTKPELQLKKYILSHSSLHWEIISFSLYTRSILCDMGNIWG